MKMQALDSSALGTARDRAKPQLGKGRSIPRPRHLEWGVAWMGNLGLAGFSKFSDTSGFVCVCKHGDGRGAT